MKQTPILFLTVALLLVTAHRLPAPIQEVQESPTPATTPTPALRVESTQTPKPTPTPKPKSSKAESTAAEPKRARPEKAVQTTIAQRTGKRFAGTWTGTMHAENGQAYPVTVVVDPTETKVTANGPVFANEEGRVQVNGDTLSWKWMLDSWSMTLNSETTAQLVKRYFSSTHTGIVRKAK
jgi:outer membrane biosynthesis protein TonB